MSSSVTTDLTQVVANTTVEEAGDVLSLSHNAPPVANLALIEYLARPVLMYTVTQTGPMTAFNSREYVSDFFDLPDIAAKLKYFAFVRGTFRITFHLTTSSYAVGKVICGEYKGPWSNVRNVSQGGEQLRMALTSMNHVILDAATCNRAELTVPVCHRTGLIDVADTNDGPTQFFYQLSYTTLSPQFFSSQDGTASPWILRIYVSLENAELSVPITKGLSTIYTSNVKTKSFPEFKAANGLISGPASIIAFAGKKLSDVPVIGPLAHASSLIATGIGHIAAAFGFSRPRIVGDESFPHAEDLASFDAPTRAKPLTIDPQAEVALPIGILGETCDNLSYDATIRRWGLYSLGTYTTYQASGTVLSRFPVLPSGSPIVLGTTNLYAPSPLAYVSSLFELWHGSIEFKFQVVANPFIRGKLRFFWNRFDNVSTTDYRAITQNAPSVLLDLTRGTEITMTVPYASVYQNLCVPLISKPITDDLTRFANGYIYVAVEESTMCPSSATQPLDIIIWMRAGEDFRYNVMTGRKLYYLNRQDYDAVYGASTQPLATREAFLHTTTPGPATTAYSDGYWAQYTAHVQPLVQTVDLMPASSQDDSAVLTLGEDFTSLRPHLKRLSFSNLYTPVTTPSQPIQGFSVPYLPPDAAFSKVSTTPYHPLAVTSPLKFVTNLFYGVRGSVRWHLQPQGQLLGDYSVTRAINLLPFASYVSFGDNPIWKLYSWAESITGRQLFRSSQGETIQFDIPQQSVHLYNVNSGPAAPPDYTYANSTYGVFVESVSKNVTASTPFACHIAAGEDFMPVIWNGVPLLSVNAPG